MPSHRERVLTALNHEEPDRVPVDLGGTQTGIHTRAYDALKRHIGLDTPTRTSNILLGLAKVEEPVLARFDIDFVHILPCPPDTWELSFLPDDSFYDEWGIRWRRPPGGYYYDMVEHPLSSTDTGDLGRYSWPDPLDAGRTRGAARKAARLRREDDRAIEAGLVGLWESAWFPVGLAGWLRSLLENPPFAEAMLDRVLSILTAMHGAYLDKVGSYIDLVTLWDDYGVQDSMLISPPMWRRLVKPRLAGLIGSLREKTSAFIGLHSCGSLAPILDDLIEVGVQVLNPVQVSARGMEPDRLKKRYGKNLTFWGGIDTQRLLPYGRAEEVAETVKETIRLMAPGGGYILSSVHNIQAGVPPQNILSLFETALL